MAMQHAHWKTEAQIYFQAHQETFKREAWAYEEQAREVMKSGFAQAQKFSDAQLSVAAEEMYINRRDVICPNRRDVSCCSGWHLVLQQFGVLRKRTSGVLASL